MYKCQLDDSSANGAESPLWDENLKTPGWVGLYRHGILCFAARMLLIISLPDVA